jgi:hypothetical protein
MLVTYLILITTLSNLIYLIGGATKQLTTKTQNALRLLSFIACSLCTVGMVGLHLYNCFIDLRSAQGIGLFLYVLMAALFGIYWIKHDEKVSYVFLLAVCSVIMLCLVSVCILPLYHFFSYEINVNAFIRYSLLYCYSMNVLDFGRISRVRRLWVIKNVSSRLSFVDPLIHNAGPKDRLMLSITSGLILSSLNLIQMSCNPVPTGANYVIYGLVCIFVFIYIIIGLRLLKSTLNVKYPISFIVDTAQTIFINISILIKQYKSNAKIVANAKIITMTVILNICFASASLCAPITPPESPGAFTFPSAFSSDADSLKLNPCPDSTTAGAGAVAEGTTVSKVVRDVVKEVRPHAEAQYNHSAAQVSNIMKDGPVNGTIAAVGMLATYMANDQPQADVNPSDTQNALQDTQNAQAVTSTCRAAENAVSTAKYEATITKLTDLNVQNEAKLAGLSAKIADLTVQKAEIAGLSATIAGLSATIADLSAEVADFAAKNSSAKGS